MYAQGSAGAAIVGRVEEVAQRCGASMAQVALAWLLARDGVAAPVVGVTTVEKLEGLIGALDVKLSEEDVRYLEEPYEALPIVGH
jgi:aryl-alcohol dehydrogenase-like predicted oxidoreductase